MKHTLIGQYDSPFVRRVAITMHHYEMPYAHHNWSVFADQARVIEVNPLCRVPILQIDGQENLIESAAILDYLDELAGPERALTPVSGAPRRQELKRSCVALAACEKAVAMVYERHKRAAGSQDAQWSRRLRMQVHSALDWLHDSIPALTAQLCQSQLTTAVLMRFLSEYLPDLAAGQRVPALDGLARECEALPEFAAVPFPGADEATAPTAG